MTAEEPPLYQRDPQAWFEHLAEGNRTQPRKRVAVEVLIHDRHGRVLLVNPSYKPRWDIPGGMAESNEPPAEAAHRELREELDLRLPPLRLLCVDWVAPHGPWDDLLMFVWDGGMLDHERAVALQPADSELTSTGFYSYDQAEQCLREDVWRRTLAALEARRDGSPVYLHNGHGESSQ